MFTMNYTDEHKLLVFIKIIIIKFCSSRRKRSVLAQFRMGILPIALETGRFINLAITDSLCVLCNLQAVDDGLRFLCVCSL